MGKYLIRVVGMDGCDDGLDDLYVNGIEADGFVLLARNGDSGFDTVALHDVSVDTVSDMIMRAPKLLCAAIMAKAKHEIYEVENRAARKDILGELIHKMAED